LEGHVSVKIGKRRQIAVHGAINIDEDHHLVRMTIHGLQNLSCLARVFASQPPDIFWMQARS
jgi:hypothetical protein